MSAAPKKASRKARENYRKVGKLIAAYTGKHKMPDVDRQLLREMLGYRNPCDTLLACDLTLRLRAGKLLSAILIALQEARPALKFYFWTFIHEKGNTSDRKPVVEIKAMQALADKALRKFDLDGISVTEVQGLTNWPQGGEGRTLLTNVHAVSWSDKSFDFQTAMKYYRDLKTWPNPFGADPVDIKLIEMTDEDFRRVAYYLFKPPYDAKRLVKTNDGVVLRSTEKGHRPEFAMRILEGLSQLDFKSIVRSTNGGSVQRQDLLRQLTHRHKSHPDWKPGKRHSSQKEEFWDRYRNKKRKNHHWPYVVKK